MLLLGFTFSCCCTFNLVVKLKFCQLSKIKLPGLSDPQGQVILVVCVCSSDRAAPNSNTRPPPGRPGVGLHHHSCHPYPAALPQTASEK